MLLCPETLPNTHALMHSDDIVGAVMNVAIDHDDLVTTAQSIADQLQKIVPYYTFLDVHPMIALKDQNANCFLRSALFHLAASQLDDDIFAGLLTESDHGWNIIASNTTRQAVMIANGMKERKFLPTLGTFKVVPVNIEEDRGLVGVSSQVALADALLNRGNCEDARILFATKQSKVDKIKFATLMANADESYDGIPVSLRVGMSALRFTERLADSQHQLMTGRSIVH